MRRRPQRLDATAAELVAVVVGQRVRHRVAHRIGMLARVVEAGLGDAFAHAVVEHRHRLERSARDADMPGREQRVEMLLVGLHAERHPGLHADLHLAGDSVVVGAALHFGALQPAIP